LPERESKNCTVFETTNIGARQAKQERVSLQMEQTNQPTFGTREPIQEEAPLTVFNPQAIAGANLAEVAHEARNMVAALGLYCDLLSEPGVLSATHQHYVQPSAAHAKRLPGLSVMPPKALATGRRRGPLPAATSSTFFS
jgi:hypothetical protein